MTTAQLDANRANAKQSTGPRSEEGKATSSQNASKHNLTGGAALIPSEDPSAYEAHLKAVTEEYGPLSPSAEFVVRQIADAMWRLQRLQRMEDELIASSDNPFLDDDDKIMIRLERLQRYRQMIERSYARFTQEWRKIIAADLLRSEKYSEEALQKRCDDHDREFQEHVNRHMREQIASLRPLPKDDDEG